MGGIDGIAVVGIDLDLVVPVESKREASGWSGGNGPADIPVDEGPREKTDGR